MALEAPLWPRRGRPCSLGVDDSTWNAYGGFAPLVKIFILLLAVACSLWREDAGHGEPRSCTQPLIALLRSGAE